MFKGDFDGEIIPGCYQMNIIAGICADYALIIHCIRNASKEVLCRGLNRCLG